MIYTNNFLMRWVARECPTELRLYFYGEKRYERKRRKNIVSMPSRVGAPFLLQNLLKNSRKNFMVSMPSRADAPFLRYPFKNIGFMRFLEPVFAGIYQNILTIAFFVHVNNLDIFYCHYHYLSCSQYNMHFAVCHLLFLSYHSLLKSIVTVHATINIYSIARRWMDFTSRTLEAGLSK